MKRTILVTEEVHNKTIQRLLRESYSDKVLLVKKFLDNNFVRSVLSKEDENGRIVVQPIVIQLDINKQPTKKTLDDVGLFELIQNQYVNLLEKEIERDLLLKQIISDWYYNKITANGSLTKY